MQRRTLIHIMTLHIPDLPMKHSAGTIAPAFFLKMDNTPHHHHNTYMDGYLLPSLPSTAAAIYNPRKSLCKVWRLPIETDIFPAELFAIHRILTYLYTICSKKKLSTCVALARFVETKHMHYRAQALSATPCDILIFKCEKYDKGRMEMMQMILTEVECDMNEEVERTVREWLG